MVYCLIPAGNGRSMPAMIPLVPVSDKEKSVIATLLLALLALPATLSAAPRTENLQLVPKWGRFERSFTSSRIYADPPEQAAFTVQFTSPLGETNPVYGFWDGGRIWRVRFSPDQPGRWSFTTLCSDTSNQGLQNHAGAFLCTAPDAGQSRFNRHGPVRLARDYRHFEHTDGTPFFWLADSAWEGARRSNPGDWETYARIRAAQKFSAVQWAVDTGGEGINPEFFKSLDAKVDALNRAGLLSVIAPFSGMDGTGGSSLPENRLAVLLRYMVARWGANDVAWLLTVDGSDPGNAAIWEQAGRAVFEPVPHAPVILRPGAGAFDRFRNEHWVDAWGYFINTRNENPLRELLSGPLATEWIREPARPSINIQSAPENRLIDGRRVTADEVRRGVWCSLLIAPPAGVGYCAEGVFNWNTTLEPKTNGVSGGGPPSWRNALDLPGARQMTTIADVFTSIDFWHLFPASLLATPQPGSPSPRRSSVAVATDAKDLELVYVPVDRTAELSLTSLPGWPTVTWINPRTGEKSAAVAVVQDSATEFPTPEPGDWLLTIKAGK